MCKFFEIVYTDNIPFSHIYRILVASCVHNVSLSSNEHLPNKIYKIFCIERLLIAWYLKINNKDTKSSRY